MEIITNGEALDLPSGFSIEIEDSNPIFNDRGSQSIPATVPATRRNNRLLDFPARLDSDADPGRPHRAATVRDGGYIRSGLLNITDAGKVDGITFNLGFDNSTAYAKWQTKKLSELSSLPTYLPEDSGGGQRIEWLIEELTQVYTGTDFRHNDLAVFPLAIANEAIESDSSKKIYWEILNVPGQRGLEQPTKVSRLINGTVTQVSIPPGYMISPFVKVWKVLELIFAALRVEIKANPFRNDRELARMVVLNNAADSCCRAEIRYADLMPDCTVAEFMNALWVRFGLVYNIDFDRHSATLRFIKDIVTLGAPTDIDSRITGPYKITYEEGQYVKLSAKSSIEKAEPTPERFEDFTKGLDISSIRLGNDVSQWKMIGTDEKPAWDGDETNGTDNTILAREFISGIWYKLDARNGAVKQQSSGFFNWDPQTENLSSLELSSDDEWVPVRRVSNIGTGTGNGFNDLCPTYLFGARHYHSYIKGCDEPSQDGDTTPLAFMLAYTKDGKTFGRLTPEGDDGKRLTLDDGSTPSLSLLFQFSDGLFARYWKQYDEILRHGNRTVEVNAVYNKLDVMAINLLEPVRLDNIKCLIDSATYSLPAGRNVDVDLKLRTLQPQGVYDIAAEQNIPKFAAAARILKWSLKSETYGPGLNSSEARRAAAQQFIRLTGYKSHGALYDEYYIDGRSMILKDMIRAGHTWENDPTLDDPIRESQLRERTYKATLIYDVYEVHDMSGSPDDPDNWELVDTPIGSVTIPVSYVVNIEAVWVIE